MSASFEAAFLGARSILVKKIDVSHGLMDELRDKKVLTVRHINDIKAEETEFDRAGKLLDILERRPDHMLPAFKEALMATEQQHIYDKYLSEEIESSRAKLRKQTEAEPTATVLSPTRITAEEMKAKELLRDRPQPSVNNYRSSFETFGQIAPEAQPVLGVASLDDELYVLRDKEQEQVEVYKTPPPTTTTTTFYNLLRLQSLPGVGYGYVCDMALCRHNRCLYIADGYNNCYVHRVELDGKVTKWSVKNKPLSLSVTSQFSVLVTSSRLENVLELTTEGKPLREIKMRSSIWNTHHVVQLSSGQFVVCHGEGKDYDHRVCIVDANGRVTPSYGGPPGSAAGELNEPHRMAVDKDGFIFVADYNNSRVLLLSPTLKCAREILSRDQLKWKPEGLFVDDKRRLLYVADGRRVIVVQL